MSTLTIHELKQLAEHQNLLGPDVEQNNFQPSSYDLRIGAIFKDNKIYSKDFEKKGFTNNIDIKPSEIVLILTLEKVSIPNDCTGTVFAMNNHSSTGLLILNPGHIDPGYSGYISICAINLSKDVKTVSIGDSIFTLILQKLTSELSQEDAFKNKPLTSRKEEEQMFLRNKSKQLSLSLFDLVSGYDGAKEMLRNILLRKFINVCRRILEWMGIVLLLYGFLDFLFNDFTPFWSRLYKKAEPTELIHNGPVPQNEKNGTIGVDSSNFK